jgi:HK97 gp10 family phage protein
MSFSLEIKGADGLKQQLRQLASMDDIKESVKTNAAELQANAKKKVRKDTRFLARSITIDIANDGMSANIYPTAEYGPYQEWGTRFMTPQPYMRPSYREQLIQFEKDLDRILKRKAGG